MERQRLGSAIARLAPGEYAYKLVVNGEEVLDPSNGVTVPNGFGSFNNVLTVEGGGGEAPVAIDFQYVSEESCVFLLSRKTKKY